MKWYLHLKYELGEPKEEWIGPFTTKLDATKHQSLYGPLFATVEHHSLKMNGPALYPLWHPEDHIEYLSRRW